MASPNPKDLEQLQTAGSLPVGYHNTSKLLTNKKKKKGKKKKSMNNGKVA